MKRFVVDFSLAIVFVTVAAAEDDLNRYIAERAAGCWTTPAAVRGIRLDAAFDVRFTRDGNVDLVQIVEFAPKTETSHALALDLADALKNCGPYVTEGMRNLTVTISWPM